MTYIDTPPSDRPWNPYPGFFWGAFTFDRLAWLYGPQRAQAMRAGRDPATNADIEAWNRLGRKVAA